MQAERSARLGSTRLRSARLGDVIAPVLARSRTSRSKSVRAVSGLKLANSRHLILSSRLPENSMRGASSDKSYTFLSSRFP